MGVECRVDDSKLVIVIDGVEVLRYTAFSDQPSGGNPAGVVLDATDLDDSTMLAIAAQVGYSETAFLWALEAAGSYRIRYFSPAGEVPFCGHATIASAVALVDHGSPSEVHFHTRSGEVTARVVSEQGHPLATLTSVKPSVAPAAEAAVAETLASLGWSASDLDTNLPARVVFAGARHLILGVRSREVLAGLSYDFERLRSLMAQEDWTTIELVWRETPTVLHARVPFPVGGIVEDPATGAGAAALGAYLRELRLVHPPVRVTVHQGDDMGRPSLLLIDLDAGDGGIRVSGRAVALPQPQA